MFTSLTRNNGCFFNLTECEVRVSNNPTVMKKCQRVQPGEPDLYKSGGDTTHIFALHEDLLKGSVPSSRASFSSLPHGVRTAKHGEEQEHVEQKEKEETSSYQTQFGRKTLFESASEQSDTAGFTTQSNVCKNKASDDSKERERKD